MVGVEPMVARRRDAGRRRQTAWLVAVAVSALVAAACGGGDDSSSTGTAGGGAVAEVSRIDAGVDVSLAEAAFSTVDGKVPVALGDAVRTDATGFAEVAYRDGSVTRLDVNTEFEIVALDNCMGTSSGRTRMGVGRTWHRIEDVAEGEDGFSVETSVATATVRGTAFFIACPDTTTCTFTVLEGSIAVRLPDGSETLLVAPATTTVTAGAASPPAPVGIGSALADPWLGDNADRDTTAGFDQLSDGSSSSVLDGLARLDGVWKVSASNARILQVSGEYLGATASVVGDQVQVIWPSDGAEGNDGVVEFPLVDVYTFTACDPASCLVETQNGTRFLTEVNGALEIVRVESMLPGASPCGLPAVPGRWTIVSDDVLRFVFWQAENTPDCANYVQVAFDIELTRVSGSGGPPPFSG